MRNYSPILAMIIANLFINIGYAQYWYGYSSMDHAGFNAMHIQPASTINSPFLFDIHVVGIESYSITPEYFPLSIKILKEDPALFLAENHKQVVGETITFPGFIWRLDKKNAVGLDIKLRSVFAIDPLESSLIDLLTDYLFLGGTESIQSDEQLISRSSAWLEVGFNYSRNIIKNNHHELNLGITPKLFFGQGSANLQVENVNIEQDIDAGVVDITGLVGLQYSQTIDDWKVDEYSFLGRTSVAFSGGLEYIYRQSLDSDHKFKAGVSVLDLGRMKYERSMYAGTFQADHLLVDAETFEQVDILKAWADLVRGFFDRIPDEEEKLIINLPSKLGLQLDYQIIPKVYINFSTYLAIQPDKSDLKNAPNFNTYVLTPRYESEKYGIGIPFIFDEYRGYSTGVSVFWGPFYLGLTNIFGSIFSEDGTNNLGGYFGVKFSKLSAR